MWRLPVDGSEARVVARRNGGLGIAAVARDVPTVLLGSDVHPHAKDLADDERLLKVRKDTKVAAILHDAYPVRFWDHDLGPAQPHLLGRGPHLGRRARAGRGVARAARRARRT